MAFARLIVSDVTSPSIEQMAYTQNTLLFMLETAAASITAGASAEDVLNAWAAAVASGRDTNPGSIANVVSTNREVVLLQRTPGIPRAPGEGLGKALKAVTVNSKNV